MPENTWNYIIGDIHGCYDELILLEKKIKTHSKKNNVLPYIISVGDLIDRGNKSAEVIEHFRLGYQNGTHIAMMGNHELLMIEALEAFAPFNFEKENCNYPSWFYNYLLNYEEGRGMSKFLTWEDYKTMTKSIWLGQGGFTTLVSYGCDPYQSESWNIPSETISYLINLPFYLETDNFVVTHALPTPKDLIFSKNILEGQENNKLEIDSPQELRNSVHSLVWNRVIPEIRIHDTKIHVSGHTPLAKVKKNKKAASVQIDTACVFGGKLTAMCIESNTYLSVKALKNYLQ